MSTDITTRIRELKHTKSSFLLSPSQWRTLELPELAWESVKFTAENIDEVPNYRGIYSFIVKHDNSSLPVHGYIVYVGLVGDNNERTLRIRYNDYLRDKIRAKRYRIHEMLNRWPEDLYFYYTVIEDGNVNLADIETALLDALIPPYNERSFSGDFGRIVKAAWQ